MLEKSSNCRVISFINMKGGVGKTTLSIGVADYLANHKKRKTLFIDMDPQFNGTQGLLDFYKKGETISLIQEKEKVNKEEAKKLLDTCEYNYYTEKIKKQEKTVYRLFTPQVSISKGYSSPTPSELITRLTDNLDIVCGDLDLVLANRSSDYSFIYRLSKFLKDNNLKENYEYIIIDCPPTLTVYTDSALYASNYYVIPNRIDRYSITGIDSLQDSIKGLIDTQDLNLKCLGIIYTMVPLGIGKKQERIKHSFESKKAVNELDIFSAESHIVNDIQVGITGGTLPTKYKESLSDIAAITEELISRTNDNESEKK